MSFRVLVVAFLSLWMISIPVWFYNLESYHLHERELNNCPYPCTLEREDSSDGLGKHVWPSRYDTNDRILEQLALRRTDGNKIKLILIHTGLGGEIIESGQDTFLRHECPVNSCRISYKMSDVYDADLVISRTGAIGNLLNRVYTARDKPRDQIVAWFNLESAIHHRAEGYVNWTLTYRTDSTMVTPYYKYKPYEDLNMEQKPTKNYAEGKTKKVAAFISNCHSDNGRLSYINELAKYIEVDIYGSCGEKKCSRKKSGACFHMLNADYKFYLSFENSHCKDYITEKFFDNGLSNDIIPVVYGARPEDYILVAPPGSFIQTDDFTSPEHLADYLHKLDQNDTLYNEYFAWKGHGEFIDTKFWCRLCAMIHEAHSSGVRVWYEVNKWWRAKDSCLSDPGDGWLSWRRANGGLQYIEDSYHIIMP